MSAAHVGPSCEGVPMPLVAVLNALRSAVRTTSLSPLERKVPSVPTVAATVGRLMLGLPGSASSTLPPTDPSAPPSMDDGAAEDLMKDCFVNTVMDASSDFSKHSDDMVWLVTNNADTDAGSAAVVQPPQQPQTSLSGPDYHAMRAMHVAVVRKQIGGNSAAGTSSGVDENSPTGRRRRASSSGRATGTLYYPTVGLNLVCQWTYTLTIAVVRVLKLPEPGKHAMVAVHRHVRRVFAAPYKGHLRDRHDATSQDVSMVGSIDYPMIHINLDDFEDHYDAITLTPGHHLAVLLVPGASERCDAAAFRGVVSYEGVMGKVQSKYVPPSSPTKKRKSFLPASSSSPSGTVCTQEGVVFIPLSASAGFGEVAVAVVDPPQRAQKESPLSAMKSATKRFFSAFSSPDSKEKSDGSGGGGGGGGVATPAGVNNNANPSGLLGTEALRCSLMNLRINVCHILSVMMSHSEPLPPPPSALGGSASAPVEPSAGGGDLPWMIVPSSPTDLEQWLSRATPSVAP